MTYTEAIRQGAAAVRRIAEKNIMQVLVSLREADMTASNNVMFRKWVKVVKDDADLLEAALLQCFTNLNDAMESGRRRSSPNRNKRTKEEIQQAANHYQKVITKIIILNQIMPNGKPMRECTGAYLRQYGGAIGRIAAKVKPNEIVGKVLSDEQAQTLWNKGA